MMKLLYKTTWNIHSGNSPNWGPPPWQVRHFGYSISMMVITAILESVRNDRHNIVFHRDDVVSTHSHKSQALVSWPTERLVHLRSQVVVSFLPKKCRFPFLPLSLYCTGFTYQSNPPTLPSTFRPLTTSTLIVIVLCLHRTFDLQLGFARYGIGKCVGIF